MLFDRLPVRTAFALPALAIALSACAPMPDLAAPGPGVQSAFFATYPQDLLMAAYQACSGPAQTARRSDRSMTCETLPTPEAAAGLILAHNGSVADLPTYVIGFRADPVEGGYLVSADSYVRIPQRGGTVAQVRLPDPNVSDLMRSLLLAAGGEPRDPL